MEEFNTTETKLSLGYEKDQSSPVKPERRLVYDKDFLLFLREHQKNDPKYLSENIDGIWNCIKIEKLQQGEVAIPNRKLSLSYKKDQWSPLNPDGRKVYDRKFLFSLREHPKSEQRPEYFTKDFIEKYDFVISKLQKIKVMKKKTYQENEVISKVSESNLHSSCNMDKNFVFNVEGKIVYSSDFLLSLQHDLNSKQKPDNLYEDIIRCSHVISIDKLPKTKDETDKADEDNDKLFQATQSNSMLSLSDQKDKYSLLKSNQREINQKNFSVGFERIKQLKSDYSLEDLMFFIDDDISMVKRQCIEDKASETNELTDNNLIEVSNDVTKFRLFYNKDQWSPINPGGRKAYDRDFLLCLREHPKSKQKPEYLSEHLIRHWSTMKIYKNNQIQRNRTDKNKNILVEPKNEVTSSNTLATNISSYNKGDGDDKSFKIVEPNSALILSNEKDQWSLLQSNQRDVSLLTFNLQPKSEEKFDSWPQDLINFKENDGIAEEETKVINSNPLDSKLYSSYMKDDWLHLNPGARIVYGKDFLLLLREHPNSQRKPEYLPNIIRKSNRTQSNPTDTILRSSPKKDQQSQNKQHPEALPSVDFIDLFENKLIEVKNVIENRADESNPAVIKLRLTYKRDQWSPLNPFGRKVYDKEFLLSLRWRVTD